MSLQISDNFSYQGRKPLDARLLCGTKKELEAIPVNTIYNGILVYVEEESTYYSYNKEHEIDASISAWTKLGFDSTTTEEIKWVVPYKQGTTFVKDTLVYYKSFIALVSDDFTSDDTQSEVEDSFNLDISNNNLTLLNREAINMVQPYKQNTYYLKDMLLFADGRIGRVLQDYMSDNTGSSIEESINIDMAAGKLREMAESYKFKLYKTTQDMDKTIDAINILPIASIVFENGETVDNMHLNEGVYGPLGTLSLIQEIDKNNQVIKTKTVTSREINFMPPAPADHKIVISLPGNNYAVNDIIDSSLDLYSIKITEVDNDGGIVAAELIDKTSNLSTNGYGAIIDASPKKYVAHDKEWYEYLDMGASEGTEKPAIVEYTPDTPYLTNTLLCLDNILYRALVNFTSSNTESEIQDNLNKDIQLGYIVRLTPEEQAIPECLGSFATDELEYFPTDAVKGNWALVLDCVVASPGQPGIALYTDNGWEITPFPKGQMEFPEPADNQLYFRTVAEGASIGSWIAFTEADGNNITINIKSTEDASYVPKKGELVWYDNKMLLGDGVTNLMALSPFYTEALDAAGISTILGYTPEDSAKKGQVNGYAPLDASGLVPKANLPLEVTDTYSKTEIDDKDAAILLSATTTINTEITRATAKEAEIENNLNTHIADSAIHVTQAEKDGWDAKVDESDLLDYDNHISDTAIHVTQSDKDRWDGMNKAYFVTSVDDLPTEDNEIGNIGYVQTSAADVTPIVCDQYLWTGTDWKKIDSSGVSLTFNWDNLTGKPSSTPLTIDNAVTIAHNHVNKIALDKIDQSPNGEFTWNGEPIGIQAIFLENENSLPDVGQENTLYIVYEDARVRNFPSISVYRNNAFQILGRGTQDAPPTVGEMSILQVEYFGVKENSTFNVTIAPQTSFCFMPVEILIEQEGQQNITNNIVSFTESEKFSYNKNLFNIDATTKLMFDIKSISTTIDTVGDYYFSHAMVDLADYYDVQGIG